MGKGDGKSTKGKIRLKMQVRININE